MAVFSGPEIVNNGLILYLDSSNLKSYPGSGTAWNDLSGNGNHFTLVNTPTFLSGVLSFDGVNDYAVSVNNLNFTSINSITTMIICRTPTTNDQNLVFEHTSNWNSIPGGFGLSLHSSGTANSANLHHTNHNTFGPRNYNFSIGTNWAHHTNIFSRISDTTGRLTSANGSLISFTSSPFPAGTATSSSSFANDKMYIASRGGTSSYRNIEIKAFLVYNRKLSTAEISQNVEIIRTKYGI